MNRHEAALTQRGLAIVAAHLNGDYTGRDALIEEFMKAYEFQRLADAFTYTSIVAVELAATARCALQDGAEAGQARLSSGVACRHAVALG